MPPKSSSKPMTPSSSTATRQYLIAYNAISLLLWATLLTRVALTLSITGLSTVYPSVGTYARNTQTLALLEVAHSLLGVVRAPVQTTAMQVASRLLLVWGIVHPFGDGLALGSSTLFSGGARDNQLAYTGMLGAWAVTECIRYGYFVLFLSNGGNAAKVPEVLSWARYNGFWVLYPVGISCECWLVFRSLGMAESWNPVYAWVLRAVLVVYVPGSYVLFTHMMKQRRRAIRGKGKVVSD